MLALNANNALLRIYSRMVSCSYMVLALMTGILFVPVQTAAVPLCMSFFYLILFQAYQDKAASGTVFYAFAMIGIASLFFVQILFFVPLLWIMLFSNILAWSTKTFCASILGLLAPYWFVAAYCVYASRMDEFCAHFVLLGQFGNIADISSLTLNHYITFAIVVVLAMTGIIHFFRNSFKDKIRTRMFFEMFMQMTIASVVFIVLQPQHYDALMGIMVVSTAPLIAHFLSLTYTRWTNYAFFAILLVVLVDTFYNTWTALSHF